MAFAVRAHSMLIHHGVSTPGSVKRWDSFETCKKLNLPSQREFMLELWFHDELFSACMISPLSSADSVCASERRGGNGFPRLK